MPKHDLEHLAGTYAIAERFVERGLRRDDSLFTRGRAIWSLAGFEELDRLYVQAFDTGEGTFERKLKIQIGGGSAAAIQLMAEIHFVYYLPARGGITGDTKRARIGEILRWATPPLEPSGESLLALRLAGALYRYWYMRGHLAEGRIGQGRGASRMSATAP